MAKISDKVAIQAEAVVVNDYGSKRVVSPEALIETLSECHGPPMEITREGREIIELDVEPISDLSPETPQKRIVSDS